jgi:hypothetical protein
VINFGDMSLDEAEAWPALLKIIRIKVKPERDANNREARRKFWWKFAERAAGLYEALAPLDRCIATAMVTKHLNFSFVSSRQILDQKVVVIVDDRFTIWSVLQSRIHAFWARLHSSTLEDRLSYSPSDAFGTFPFPDESTLAANTPLEAVAKRLYENRAAYMVATDQGLTKTYNALTDPTNSDPELVNLRRLHEQLDRAVLDAYSQTRIDVPPYAGASAEQIERFRDQVLDFLFARNALLAKREAAARARAQR